VLAESADSGPGNGTDIRPEIARLGDVELVPGMPVEAFVKTGDRTVISYLMSRYPDQISRAFRE
jgi:membrane fusion protein, type I secretion system